MGKKKNKKQKKQGVPELSFSLDEVNEILEVAKDMMNASMAYSDCCAESPSPVTPDQYEKIVMRQDEEEAKRLFGELMKAASKGERQVLRKESLTPGICDALNDLLEPHGWLVPSNTRTFNYGLRPYMEVIRMEPLTPMGATRERRTSNTSRYWLFWSLTETHTHTDFYDGEKWEPYQTRTEETVTRNRRKKLHPYFNAKHFF